MVSFMEELISYFFVLVFVMFIGLRLELGDELGF